MYNNEPAGLVIYQGIFLKPCLKIKENIISTASSFGRIGKGDYGQRTGMLPLEPYPKSYLESY
jgi:hypothetical protein